MHFILVFLLIFSLFSCQSPEEKEKVAEAGVRRAVEGYNSALNRREINALLDFWSDEAVYRNPVTGILVRGKESIKKEYFVLLDVMQGSNVEMKVHSISFPFEGKAVVEGVLHLQIPGEKAIGHDFTIIFVKKEGEWKILNLSEISI